MSHAPCRAPFLREGRFAVRPLSSSLRVGAKVVPHPGDARPLSAVVRGADSEQKVCLLFFVLLALAICLAARDAAMPATHLKSSRRR
jgi:hypothetical protein